MSQIEVFVSVARSGSISGVARQLYVSPSAVSQQLKLLEHRLGVHLFRKSGRRLVLTPVGQSFLQLASNALSLLGQGYALTESHARASHWRVNVGANPSWAFYYLPNLLRKLQERLPELRLDLHIHDSVQLYGLVRSYALDFAFVCEPIPEGEFERVLVGEEQLVLACPVETWGDGTGNPPRVPRALILPPRGSRPRSFLDSRLAPMLSDRLVVYEIQSFEGIKRAILAGLGAGIVPLESIREELRNGQVRVLETPGFPITRKRYLVWNSGLSGSAVLSRFVEQVVACSQGN